MANETKLFGSRLTWVTGSLEMRDTHDCCPMMRVSHIPFSTLGSECIALFFFSSSLETPKKFIYIIFKGFFDQVFNDELIIFCELIHSTNIFVFNT